MIRKLILSAVIATAALIGLSLTPTAAEAAPFHHRADGAGKCAGCTPTGSRPNEPLITSGTKGSGFRFGSTDPAGAASGGSGSP